MELKNQQEKFFSSLAAGAAALLYQGKWKLLSTWHTQTLKKNNGKKSRHTKRASAVEQAQFYLFFTCNSFFFFSFLRAMIVNRNREVVWHIFFLFLSIEEVGFFIQMSLFIRSLNEGRALTYNKTGVVFHLEGGLWGEKGTLFFFVSQKKGGSTAAEKKTHSFMIMMMILFYGAWHFQFFCWGMMMFFLVLSRSVFMYFVTDGELNWEIVRRFFFSLQNLDEMKSWWPKRQQKRTLERRY